LVVVWASVRLWKVVIAIDSGSLAAMGTEVSREAEWRGCGPVTEMTGGHKDCICLALAFLGYEFRDREVLRFSFL